MRKPSKSFRSYWYTGTLDRKCKKKRQKLLIWKYKMAFTKIWTGKTIFLCVCSWIWIDLNQKSAIYIAAMRLAGVCCSHVYKIHTISPFHNLPEVFDNDGRAGRTATCPGLCVDLKIFAPLFFFNSQIMLCRNPAVW